jgi:MFS transporter, DHA1 family, tetracycline resistance protein
VLRFLAQFFKSFASAITTFTRAPAAAQVGMALFFAAAVADGILMPFFALWAHKVAGIPIAFIGLLLGCYAGGELLATPFVGGIADRVGRRPVLLVSACGVGCGFLLLYMVHGAIAVAASLIVIGVFESVLHPTASTVIADVVPAETRREHFAARRVMSSAGSMAGPALGALLALRSLGLVFLRAGLTLLLGALVVAIYLAETRPPDAAPGEEDDDESLLVLTAVFHDHRLAGLIVPVALIEIAASWIASITPLYADTGGALTASGVGLLFTYAGALGVVLQMPITHASERMKGSRIVLVSGAVQAAAFVCLFVSPALPSLLPQSRCWRWRRCYPDRWCRPSSPSSRRAPRRRPIRRHSVWSTISKTPPGLRSGRGCSRLRPRCSGRPASWCRSRPRSGLSP